MFRLIPDASSDRDLDNLAHFFSTLGLRIAGRNADEIGDAVRDGIAQNFVLQGSATGPWQELRPTTQEERAAKGFPAKRPLLYRTGDLRDSFVAEGDPDHYQQAFQSSNLFALEIGSDDYRANALQAGYAAHNLPPRPIVDLRPQAERHVGDTIDAMILRLMRGEGL
jgi:hypothetical protein